MIEHRCSNRARYLATGIPRELRIFAAAYGRGYTIIECDEPRAAEGALGTRGSTCAAQLCTGGVIAAVPSVQALHSIAHEIGHAEVAERFGEAAFNDEGKVAVEQIAFLVRFAQALLGVELAQPRNPHVGSELDTAHMAETGHVRVYEDGACPEPGCGHDEPAQPREPVDRVRRGRLDPAPWDKVSKLVAQPIEPREPTARERLGRWLAEMPGRVWYFNTNGDGDTVVYLYHHRRLFAHSTGPTEDAAIAAALSKLPDGGK